jgi:murein DD-endopeptidase MepM/ murein hydrolase activator NlpD
LSWALAAILLVTAAPAAALEIRITPPSPGLGEIAVVRVTGARGARGIEGTLGSQPLRFFPSGEQYAALVGVDLEARPGETRWRVDIVDPEGRSRTLAGSIALSARRFPIQRLTLPRSMVDLDPETEQRARAEAARLHSLYRTVTPERLWQGRFTRPVASDHPGEGFGSRRIINGQPRMPHSGVDFAADRGTPVVAANRGRVALVGDFFFAGRCAVLDHGLGLYTLYFHLDHVDVAEGALVERGEVLGVVGATGRATGPHLHWGAQLGSARVDPSTLLTVAISD